MDASSAQGAELSAFLRELALARNRSQHTVRAYGADIGAYREWCRREGVDWLHPGRRALRAYLGYLNAGGYARSTVNRHLSSIRTFFAWLVDNGVVRDDPTTTISGMKRPKRLPRRIGQEEMMRILAVHAPCGIHGEARDQSVADMRDQAVLELLYASGCRVSEAAGLRIGDVDFHQALVRVYGKGSKERIVPLHDLSLSSLAVYLDRARPALVDPLKPGDALFLSNRGNPYSSAAIRKMFERTLEEAGVAAGYTPHDMRHTFASDMLEGGAGLRSVQELLGHASPATTQIYTHLSPQYLKDVHHQAHPRG